MPLSAIPPLISAIFAIGIGIFVFLKNTKRLVNRSFLLAMFALFIREAGMSMFLYGNPYEQIGSYVSTFGDALIPGTWLLFSLAFSRRDVEEGSRNWNYLLIILFILPVGVYIYSLQSEFIQSAVELDDGTIYLIHGAGYLFYGLFLIGFAFVLANLEATLRASSMEKRWKIKFMIIGFGGMVAFLIYETSQVLLYSYLQIHLIPITSIVIIVCECLIGVSLLRDRLLDVDVFVSRYAAYNTFALLFIGVYLIVVALIIKWASFLEIDLSASFVSLLIFLSLIGLILILLSDRLRIKAKLFINRHFYKHKYDFRQKWMEVSDKIGGETELESLQEGFMTFLMETFHAKKISIWFYKDKRGGYFMTSGKGMERLRSKVTPNSRIVRHLMENRPTFIDRKGLLGLYPSGRDEGEDVFLKTDTEVCAPLVVKDRLLGFYTMGSRVVRDPFGPDDVALLNAVTQQFANQIMSIKLSDELLAARESEAFHSVTSFLVHDVKNVNSMLTLALENSEEFISNPEFQKDLLMTIKMAKDKLTALLERLTDVRKGEELFLQETDMKAFLNEVIDNFSSKIINGSKGKSFKLSKKLSKTPKVRIDRDKIRGVVFNLLLNAFEALEEEGTVRVELSMNKDDIVLEVSDTGPGMSDEFIDKYLFRPFKTTKIKGFGVGLYQCKKVIEAHNGSIEVDSEVGKGTTFYVKLPVNR